LGSAHSGESLGGRKLFLSLFELFIHILAVSDGVFVNNPQPIQPNARTFTLECILLLPRHLQLHETAWFVPYAVSAPHFGIYGERK